MGRQIGQLAAAKHFAVAPAAPAQHAQVAP